MRPIPHGSACPHLEPSAPPHAIASACARDELLALSRHLEAEGSSLRSVCPISLSFRNLLWSLYLSVLGSMTMVGSSAAERQVSFMGSDRSGNGPE